MAISALSLVGRGIVTSKPARKLRAKWSRKGTEPDNAEDEVVQSAEPSTKWARAKETVSAVGSPTIFAFKVVRLAVVVAFLIVATVTAGKEPWTWYSAAPVGSLVRFIQCWYTIRRAHEIILGVLCASCHSQCVHTGQNEPYILLPSLTGAILRIWCLRVSRHMASHDIHAATSRPSRGAHSMGQDNIGRYSRRCAALVRAIPVYTCGPEGKYSSLLRANFSKTLLQDPSPQPNLEQTSSIFVFLTYIFMDTIIFKASRTTHLGFDELPPLCDYDATKNLIKRSYPVRLVPDSI